MDDQNPSLPDNEPSDGQPSDGQPSNGGPSNGGPSNGYPNGSTDAQEIAERHGFRLGAPTGAVSRGAAPAGNDAETRALADEFATSLQTADRAFGSEKEDDIGLADVLEGPNDVQPSRVASPEIALAKAVAARDKELDLIEHLRELRTRMLWCVGIVGVLMVVAWNFGKQIQDWFVHPIQATLTAKNVKFGLITTNPLDGFTVYFQIVLATALLASAPFILYQMWAFIEPALTHGERRYVTILAPFSTALFVAGAALGYLMSPVFFYFFLAFQPKDSVALWSYQTCVALLAKMMLVFGVCFQTPVITIFIMKVGLVSRNVLLEYWRHAVVAIFVIVAIITPTWDPVTLIVCATPPCVLYALSLWMVKWL